MFNPQLDTLEYSRDTYDESLHTMAFKATTKLEAEAWQTKLRTVLIDLIGGFPAKKSDLSPKVIESKRFATYSRETIVFQSRPNMSVYGYFLLPNQFEWPGPAILCIHGHGRGVDDIVGIRKDGGMRSRYGGYQRDFALQCVRNGYAVLAIDQFGFGHRRDGNARNWGDARSSCLPAAGAALLLGETMVGWRVWDAIRSLDYLTSRTEVDTTRLGIMGISGGGTTAFFSAALDDRIKVAIVSGYFNTFRDSILSKNHCIDNYIPGVLRHGEMYDIAGLIAPRAMFVESGTQDPLFPADATRTAVSRARKAFYVLGAEEKLGIEVFEGKHQFYGVGAFKFLSEML